jgi:hypothetical protein
MKAKIKKVLAGHASGIKASDFPREWEKVTPLKPLTRNSEPETLKRGEAGARQGA